MHFVYIVLLLLPVLLTGTIEVYTHSLANRHSCST